MLNFYFTANVSGVNPNLNIACLSEFLQFLPVLDPSTLADFYGIKKP